MFDFPIKQTFQFRLYNQKQVTSCKDGSVVFNLGFITRFEDRDNFVDTPVLWNIVVLVDCLRL